MIKIIVVAIVCIIAGFVGGIQYQKSKPIEVTVSGRMATKPPTEGFSYIYEKGKNDMWAELIELGDIVSWSTPDEKGFAFTEGSSSAALIRNKTDGLYIYVFENENKGLKVVREKSTGKLRTQEFKY